MKTAQTRLLFLVVMLMIIPVGFGYAEDPPEEEAARSIVFFEEGAGIDEALLQEAGLTYEPIDYLDVIDAVVLELYPKETEALLRDPRVTEIHPDETVYSDQFWINAGFSQINAQAVPRSGLSGDGIKVGVMDTGISTTHPDLRYVEGYNFLDDNTDVEDENGHGTHVAGILAAGQRQNGMLGVAPGVDLYVAKIMDERGQGFESNMVKSIEWAMEKELDIVNLSVGSQNELFALKRMLEIGTEEGMLFVGAAGNRGETVGQSTTVDYPARYPEVIAVGAVTSLDIRAPFSGYGPELEVVAPGVRINSTSTGTSYERKSGTSMAAPYVAGMLAVMKEGHPGLSADELRQKLREDEWIRPLGFTQPNRHTGYGRIQFADEIPVQPLPPAAVKNLTVRTSALTTTEAVVDVSWEAPDEDDLTYRVWRNNRVIYEGEETAVTDKLTADGDYTYSVAAVRDSLESDRVQASPVRIRLASAHALLLSTFSDIEEDVWYNDPLAFMVERGLISGYPDGTIRPNAPVTRGEVVAILDRYLDWPDATQQAGFTDTAGHFAESAIRKAANEGAVQGFRDGTFRPGQAIIRADAAVILDRVFDYNTEGMGLLFPDVDLGSYYATAVMNLSAAGIIGGYQDGSFRPERTITRAEFAAMIKRTVMQLEEEVFEEDLEEAS